LRHQQFAEKTQHRVAGSVTESIVDALEVIDVDDDHRHRAIRAFAQQRETLLFDAA